MSFPRFAVALSLVLLISNSSYLQSKPSDYYQKDQPARFLKHDPNLATVYILCPGLSTLKGDLPIYSGSTPLGYVAKKNYLYAKLKPGLKKLSARPGFPRWKRMKAGRIYVYQTKKKKVQTGPKSTKDFYVLNEVASNGLRAIVKKNKYMVITTSKEGRADLMSKSAVEEDASDVVEVGREQEIGAGIFIEGGIGVPVRENSGRRTRSLMATVYNDSDEDRFVTITPGPKKLVQKNSKNPKGTVIIPPHTSCYWGWPAKLVSKTTYSLEISVLDAAKQGNQLASKVVDLPLSSEQRKTFIKANKSTEVEYFISLIQD